MRLWPGSPFPLGATYDGTGTNFAVFSEVADAVELCLFEPDGAETRIALPERTAMVWHGYAPKLGPGQRYGFRVRGPYEPSAGLRCHPSKLLLDPYATAVEGEVDWDEAMFTYRFDDPDGPLNDLDSAAAMPKGVVTSPFFDWGNDRPPATPWARRPHANRQRRLADVQPGDPLVQNFHFRSLLAVKTCRASPGGTSMHGHRPARSQQQSGAPEDPAPNT